MFKIIACVLSSATKIERADFVCSSYIPSLLSSVGGFLFHWFQWTPNSNMNSWILLWFIPENSLFSSVLAPIKFVQLSVLMTWTLLFLDTNLWSICMKASTESKFIKIKLMGLPEGYVKDIHVFSFLSKLPWPR